MANLAQIITLQIFVHTLFFQKKKSAEIPIFIVFLQTVLKKKQTWPR